MKKQTVSLAVCAVVITLTPLKVLAGNPINDILKGVTGVMDVIVYGENRQGAAKKKQPEMSEEMLQQIEKIREQAKYNNEEIAKAYLVVEKGLGPDYALEAQKVQLEKLGYTCSITNSEKHPENRVLISIDPTRIIVMTLEVDKKNSQIIVKSIVQSVDVEETYTQQFEIHKDASAEFAAIYTFDLYREAGFDISDKAKSAEGYLIVNKVAPNSLASNIQLLPGAEVYAIDGESTQNMRAEEFRMHINFKKYKKENFNITFMTEGGSKKTLNVNLNR